jgi:large subunit ribosomal protein L21
MYAVIQTGGKQLRVQPGDVIRVERLAADVGSAVVFERVLMLGGEGSVKLGAPEIGGARVRGTVLAHDRAKKIVMYVFKRRQNANRRTQGHRQNFTAVKIEAIEAVES